MKPRFQIKNLCILPLTRSSFLSLLSVCFIACLFGSGPLYANNLDISNVRLLDQSDSGDTIVVEFDISWSNAWRDSINYDAVWVFIKYLDASGVSSPWLHATLNAAGTNPTGFSVGDATVRVVDIIVSNDKKGAFIQLASQESGSVNSDDVQFVWNYGTDGVDDDNVSDGDTTVDVFGIEMTYIPEGGFYVGDGNDGASSGEAQIEFGSASSLPAHVSSAGAIYFDDVTEDGWYYNTGLNSLEYGDGSTFFVPASWPKGFQAFYLMKYELTQGQYVEFLNALPRAAQDTRTESDVSTDDITNFYVMSNTSTVLLRDEITAPSAGNGTASPITFVATRSDRGAHHIGWMDMLAYADWAALRPYTEFEYEKASRGPIYPLIAEYAWGTTSFTAMTGIAVGGGGIEDGTETPVPSGANSAIDSHNYGTTGDGGVGPVRAGIFALGTTDTREESGAGYYGNMELAGNVEEQVVTVGNSAGLGFAGTHGDGILTDLSSYEGNATNLDWPGIDAVDNARGVTATTGGGQKGDDYTNIGFSRSLMETSNRSTAAAIVPVASARGATKGGRLARTEGS